MSEQSFKSAKSGYDARTANPKDLTIDSSKNTIKLFADYTGTATIAGGGTYSASVNISHNLGYQPYAEVYYKRDSNAYWQKAPSLNYDLSTFKIVESVFSERTDSNVLKVSFLTGDPLGGGTAASFEYLIRIYINAWEGSWDE